MRIAGFFQALTLPIGVYATEAEFVNYQVASKALEARLDLAVEKALPHLKYRNLASEQASPVINHQELATA